jgi:hypothetical protein
MINSEDVAAIKELIRAQFRSLAWTRDEDANWAVFAQGFLPGATLFPAARPVQAKSIDQFVDRMRRLRSEGKLVIPLGLCSRPRPLGG